MPAVTTPSSLASTCLDLANKAGWVGRGTLKPTWQTCKEILVFGQDLQTRSLPKYGFVAIFPFFFFPSLQRTEQALCSVPPLPRLPHVRITPAVKAVAWEVDVLSLVPCFGCTVCVGGGLQPPPLPRDYAISSSKVGQCEWAGGTWSSSSSCNSAENNSRFISP